MALGVYHHLGFVFLLVLASATANENHLNHLLKKQHSLGSIDATKQRVGQNFDYLILRQIWPATSCMFPGPNKCTIAKNITTWVVHGLW